MCQMADQYAEAGFVPVLDDVVVSAPVLDVYVERLATRPFAFVQLIPELAAIERRDAGRDKHVAGQRAVDSRRGAPRRCDSRQGVPARPPSGVSHGYVILGISG